MAKFIGRKVELAVGLESSRGVGVAPAYGMGKVDFSLYDKTVDARDDESLGHIADSKDKFVQEKYSQGEVGGILGANSALYLLSLALGSAPSTGATSDGATSHTIAVANTNIHKSAAFLVKDENQTVMHKLVMLEQLELTMELEDLVRYSAEFVSKVAKSSTQTIPTYVEDYKFGKRKAKIKVASDVSGLAAASVLSLKSFTLTINKNLMRDSALGTVEPEDILNQQMSIEGELSINFTDQTFRNYMLNGDKKALRISLESEKLIGSSTYGTIEIDLPKVDFFGWEPDVPNDEIVTNTINFKANYDLTNGLVESCTVVNALATA